MVKNKICVQQELASTKIIFAVAPQVNFHSTMRDDI